MARADGFWSLPEPTRHFRTAAGVGSLMAEALLRLVCSVESAAGAGRRIGTVLDIGAGSGALLTQLHQLAPGLRLVGLDQSPRPDHLPPGIEWHQDRWDVTAGGWTGGAAQALIERWASASTASPHGAASGLLAVCCEWLDDLPATVAVRRGGGWIEATADGVDADAPDHPGAGNPGPTAPRLTAADAAWAERWSGASTPSADHTVIVGRTRDRAWRWVLDAVAAAGGGMAVLVDYGRRSEEGDPGIRGYAWGREVPPDPGRLMNLTAAVTVDSLVAAGQDAGARTVLLARQRDVLSQLAQTGATAGSDELQTLVRRSQLARLCDPAGWGGHWWLAQAIGSPSLGGDSVHDG